MPVCRDSPKFPCSGRRRPATIGTRRTFPPPVPAPRTRGRGRPSVRRGAFMLTIFGKPHRKGGFCDGLSRRDFLTVGGTLVGGALALPNLLAAEAQSGVGASHKAIINVYLPGGPPHIDMWDLKPDAPADIRGEFKPDRHQRPRHPHLRALPAHRQDGGQVRLHPHDGRQRRRPRLLPVHDRPAQGTAPGGLLAVDGGVGVEGAGPGRPGRAAARLADVPDRQRHLGLSRHRRLPRPGPRTVPSQRRDRARR